MYQLICIYVSQARRRTNLFVLQKSTNTTLIVSIKNIIKNSVYTTKQTALDSLVTQTLFLHCCMLLFTNWFFWSLTVYAFRGIRLWAKAICRYILFRSTKSTDTIGYLCQKNQIKSPCLIVVGRKKNTPNSHWGHRRELIYLNPIPSGILGAPNFWTYAIF